LQAQSSDNAEFSAQARADVNADGKLDLLVTLKATHVHLGCDTSPIVRKRT